MIVNRTELADVFGVSPPTVDAWLRAGCPIEQRGSRGVAAQYDTARVAKWRQERAIQEATGDAHQDADEIDRRTKRAKMRQAELEVAKEMGAVATVRDFERAQASRYAIIRQKVMNVAQRAALQLLGEKDETVFKDKLRKELALALESAASEPIDLVAEDDGDDAGTE